MTNQSRDSYDLHRLPIPRDWTSTQSQQGEYTEFQYISSEQCPGYKFQITHWRLQSTSIPSPDNGPALNNHVMAEVSRAIGEAVYEKCVAEREASIAAAVADAIRNGQKMPLRKPESIKAKLLEEVTQASLIAYFQFILKPQIANLAIPLITLCMRDNLLYVIEKETWPDSEQPFALQHLAATGFEGMAPYGILAQSALRKGSWVVQRFVRGTVRLNWNRPAAIRAEFPWINDIGSLTRCCKDIKASLDKKTSRKRRAASKKNARKGGRPRDLLWDDQADVRMLWNKHKHLKFADRCEEIRKETGSSASDHTIARIAMENK